MEKIEYITNLMAELKYTKLSSKCGKYFELGYNGESVYAVSFEGRYGYETTDLKDLKPKVVDKIYNDLVEYYGD